MSSIAFNEIPIQVFTPGAFVEFDGSAASRGLQIQPHDTLIVGNKTSAGSATAGQIYLCKGYEHAITLGGQHSQIAQMVRQYKAKDKRTPLYICCLDDAVAGAKSSGGWAISGTATEAGEIAFYVAGRRFTVSVASGDAAAAVATAAAAQGALLTDCPVAVTDGGLGALDADAVHAAAFSDQIKIGHSLHSGEQVPAGLSIVVTQPTLGSGDSDHAGAVTAMAEDQYNTMVCGVYTTTEIAKLVTELEAREAAMIGTEGVLFAAVLDSQADITTYSANFNSHALVMVGGEENGLLPTPWELAAQTAGMNAARVQVDPSRHLAGEKYSGFSAAARGSRFSRTERDTLLEDGISTVKAAGDGSLIVDRLCTTQVLNAQSVADFTWYELTHVRTLHAIRYTVVARMTTKFAQYKLADDGSAPRPRVVTPSVIRAEAIALFGEWYDQGWVENPAQFEADIICERDPNDVNRVNLLLPPDLINSFFVLAAQVQFIK